MHFISHSVDAFLSISVIESELQCCGPGLWAIFSSMKYRYSNTVAIFK